MRRSCLACSAAGRTKPPRRGVPSRASPSLMRPVATASGWRAGCGCVALRPMSFIQPAFPCRANTGGPKRTGSKTSCSNGPFSGGCAARPPTAAWGAPGTRAARAPTPPGDEEDAKRPSRERETLVSARTRLVNRIKGTLVRLGIRGFQPTLRTTPERLEAVRTPEGAALPPNTLAELRRDLARLRFVRDQIKEIEQTRIERLEQAPPARRDAMVGLLARVIGVGVETADMLVHEVLSRNLRDRRAVARYAGLTGAPDESGAKRREKGLAKVGNARVR